MLLSAGGGDLFVSDLASDAAHLYRLDTALRGELLLGKSQRGPTDERAGGASTEARLQPAGGLFLLTPRPVPSPAGPP